MKPSKEKVVLDVGGLRFETYASTLRTFPETKLCSLTEPQATTIFDYDPETKAFFFDRSPSLFEEVLNYYRTQHLHCPELTCKAVLDAELAFWGLSNTPLAPCCWLKLINAEGKEKEEEEILREEDRGADGLLDPAERIRGGWRGRWQSRIWTLFERPFSSLSAKCLAVVTLLFNIGICVLFIAKAYGDRPIHHIPAHHWEAFQDNEVHPQEIDQGFSYLVYLEFFCVLWFTLEFCLRFTSCAKKKKFLQNPLNLADLFSLFPVFIELSLKGPATQHPHLLLWLDFFRALYFIKLLKVLKLVETPVMLKVLSYTSRTILRETVILLMAFVFEILFFGTLCYFADFIEDDPETLFDSIGSSFWWAIITLTTVGYGDFYPNSLASKLIGACAAFCGVLTIITPIPLFFIKFKGYYDAVMIQEKRKKKRKQAPTLPWH